MATPAEEPKPLLFRLCIGVVPLLHWVQTGQVGVGALSALFLVVCQGELAGAWLIINLVFLILEQTILVAPRAGLLAAQILCAALFAWRGRLVPAAPEPWARWPRGRLRHLLWTLSIILAWSYPFHPWPLEETVHWSLLYYLAGREFPGPLRAPRRLRPLRTALLTCTALGIAIAILELGCRLALPLDRSRSSLFLPHPKYLYTLRPGFETTDGIRARLDAGVSRLFPTRISSAGLRDHDYGPKAPDEFRILMLGDSFTFGWPLPPEGSPPKRLEARLQERGFPKTISVINGGVPGYAPWQARGLLLEQGLALEPDLVILQTFVANDLADSLLQKDEALPRLEAYDLNRLRAVLRLRLHEHGIVALENWLLRHSSFYNALQQVSGQDLLLTRLLTGDTIAPPLEEQPDTKRNCLHEPDLKNWYPELEEAWCLFTQDILDMREDCAARGIPFLAYNIPYPINQWRALYYFSTVPDLDYELDQGARLVDAFFTAARIPHIPMIEPVRSSPMPFALDYPDNIHLTQHGVELVTHEIEAYLLREILPQIGIPVPLPWPPAHGPDL